MVYWHCASAERYITFTYGELSKLWRRSNIKSIWCIFETPRLFFVVSVIFIGLEWTRFFLWCIFETPRLFFVVSVILRAWNKLFFFFICASCLDLWSVYCLMQQNIQNKVRFLSALQLSSHPPTPFSPIQPSELTYFNLDMARVNILRLLMAWRYIASQIASYFLH